LIGLNNKELKYSKQQLEVRSYTFAYKKISLKMKNPPYISNKLLDRN